MLMTSSRFPGSGCVIRLRAGCCGSVRLAMSVPVFRGSGRKMGAGRAGGAGGVMGEEFGGEPAGLPSGLAAGLRVAGYRLERQVGAGGMAVVFRARDERL